MIYFDNAATSFPKPAVVTAALVKHLATEAVNPGRSGFDLSRTAGENLDSLRRELSRFFHLPGGDPQRVVFTNNATSALNIALQGVLRPGDHLISTRLEHNSVLRPLNHLRKKGISIDLAPADEEGFLSVESIAQRIRPETRLVAITHASNVLGTIQPVAKIGDLCREKGILLLVDAAQTAGNIPVEMQAMGAHLLAFTGHKGLMGPTGTGGLLVAPDVDVEPSFWGGTGVRSREELHPTEYPHRLEAGTLNALGLAGLAAGLKWVQDQPVVETKKKMVCHFLENVAHLKHVRILGRSPGDASWNPRSHVPVFSLIVEGMAPEKVGMFLDAEWDIAVRTGLQCSPLVHDSFGSGGEGTVRVSFGPLNTIGEVDTLLEALASFA